MRASTEKKKKRTGQQNGEKRMTMKNPEET